METYQSKDVQAIAGISKIQLNHWVNKGAIIPLQDNRGRGKVRHFSFENIVEAFICGELNKYGVSASGIVQVLDSVRKERIVKNQVSQFQAGKRRDIIL